MSIASATVAIATASGCGSDAMVAHDAGTSIHLWPETVVDGGQVGVYLEVAGLTGAKLDLQAFDGTLCGVGATSIDAGVPTTDAGVPSTPNCEQRTQFDVAKTPQTFVVVFKWNEGLSSGLLTATALIEGKETLSVFRRISKSSPPPDAGIDADGSDTPADASTGDAQ
jgi:hypothetical protein